MGHFIFIRGTVSLLVGQAHYLLFTICFGNLKQVKTGWQVGKVKCFLSIAHRAKLDLLAMGGKQTGQLNSAGGAGQGNLALCRVGVEVYVRVQSIAGANQLREAPVFNIYSAAIYVTRKSGYLNGHPETNLLGPAVVETIKGEPTESFVCD